MRVPTLLCLPLLLAACGQAGDLYLPDKEPVKQVATPEAASTPPAAPAAPQPDPTKKDAK